MIVIFINAALRWVREKRDEREEKHAGGCIKNGKLLVYMYTGLGYAAYAKGRRYTIICIMVVSLFCSFIDFKPLAISKFFFSNF